MRIEKSLIKVLKNGTKVPVSLRISAPQTEKGQQGLDGLFSSKNREKENNEIAKNLDQIAGRR